jgi:hypothetical protein
MDVDVMIAPIELEEQPSHTATAEKTSKHADSSSTLRA